MERLCGFNLGNWFSQTEFTPEKASYYAERDLRYVADLGFNFIRLPLDYSFFEVEPYKYDEARLCLVDRAVSWASKYGLHLLLDLHVAPGYGIGRSDYSLWRDQEKQKRTAEIWKYLTRRYRDYGKELAFDLVNEPGGVSDADLKAFYEKMIAAIREEDEDREIYVEGNEKNRVYASSPVFVKEYKVVYSFHHYEPLWVTHLGASWAGLAYQMGIRGLRPDYPGKVDLDDLSKEFPSDWFLKYNGVYADKNWIEGILRPYLELADGGKTTHCSEFGVFSKMAKRSTALNWYRDVLSIFKEHGIGWALWNLRGSFGIISTGRDDWMTGKTPWGEPMDSELLSLLRDYARRALLSKGTALTHRKAPFSFSSASSNFSSSGGARSVEATFFTSKYLLISPRSSLRE